MKNYLYILMLLIGVQSCSSQTDAKVYFKKLRLGGEDIHGDLYQKKYPKSTDSSIKYKKWEGVEVSSNKEIKALLKHNPKCEAIRFTYMNYDTLNNFDLTEDIGEFQNLKFLEIHSNKNIKYPKILKNLSTLEELVLQINNTINIEFDFSNFQNLKHLTIHFADDLKTFPTTIFECKNLQTLKLFRFFSANNNVLNGIEKLENLKEIYIWDSHLILPKNAEYKFKHLETLIIDRSSNPLPEYFYTNKTIKRMALNSYSDTLDLNRLSQMENLENLYLQYQNEFTGSLRLPKLEHLYFYNFKGESMDINFGELKELTSLVVWECPNLKFLKNVSGEKIRSLVIVHNKNLQKIQINPEKLKKIEQVIMRKNDSLSNRPDEINGVTVQKSEL